MTVPFDTKREVSEPPTGPALRLFIPPDARFGAYVRKRVMQFAGDLGASNADVTEFVSAVFEAFANAVEHSRSQECIDVRCWTVGDNQLLATVTDRGVGFRVTIDPVEAKSPDPLAERGRGLTLMRRFTDRLYVSSSPGKGTAITLGRYLRRFEGGSASGD